MHLPPVLPQLKLQTHASAADDASGVCEASEDAPASEEGGGAGGAGSLELPHAAASAQTKKLAKRTRSKLSA
jgi:hypothetical protein